MKAKYQKYYDALKGANIGTGQGNLSSAFSSAKTSFNSAKTSLSSTSYTELAATTISNITIPKIGEAIDKAGTGADIAIAEVVTSVTELVSMLEALDSLEKELESLGSKWTYTEGGSKSKSEVNSHNNKIDELTKKVEEQESSIDGEIAAINGITVDSVDISSLVPSAENDFPKQEETTEETTQDGLVQMDNSPSGVLAYQAGDLSEKGQQTRYINRRALLLDVQVDGNSLGQDGTIVIKRGQTVHLKVKVPDEIQNVQTLKRTSADGKRGWSQWVSQKNYPQVNKKDPSTYANQREYDWYITGNTNTDNITLSQTALFTIPGEKYGSYKGMVRVRVKIVD